MTKPFSPRELVLRVQAILRRGRAAVRSGRRSFGGGELVVDEDRREVVVRGSVVELTPSEWGVLTSLARSPGRVYSRFDLVTSTGCPSDVRQRFAASTPVRSCRRSRS